MDSKINELPHKEKPASLLEKKYPAITKFNPKTVKLVTLMGLISIVFAVLTAFVPNDQKTKAANVATKAQSKTESNVSSSNNAVLEGLNEIPSTYDQAGLEQNNGFGKTEALLGDESSEFTMAGRGYEGDHRGESPEQKELNAAQKSPIRFGNSNNNLFANAGNDLNQTAPAGNQPITNQPGAVNNQDTKLAFLNQNRETNFYATARLQAPLSQYELKAGSIIPGILITGINSDLPGRIIGQVRENVYDSVSGNYLLIPQGTKIIGTYDSKVNYAQSRVLIVWTRLIFPNGYSLNLERLPGTDLAGQAGFKDLVNNHTGKLIGGVILTSALSAAAKIAGGNQETTATYGQLAVNGAAENMANAGARLLEQNLNVQPTLEIRGGYRFNILVEKDFILQPYEVAE